MRNKGLNVIETTLVIGGCRSGKSAHAQSLAERIPGGPKVYIATCVPGDDEMRQRVAQHQALRGPAWTTAEVPIDLAGAVEQNQTGSRVVLVDCLTLWTTNLLMDKHSSSQIEKAVADLTQVLQTPRCPIILVTNEVGTGIVPENRLARRFRDLAGWTNQQVAAAVNKVFWTVAGIPVKIKPQP